MSHFVRPDYGIDAPGLCRFFILGGAGAAVLCAASAVLTVNIQPWGAMVTGLLAVPSLYLLGMGVFMIYESKITKLIERERLLDLAPWSGHEAVLDVGCGRGLMLIGAALRLSSGKAVGVDIWQAQDQSANTPDGPLENARLEGVLDRVEVRTADMRQLPFADQTFDVILSHWAVHNLKDAADRARALSEMHRVLKPGGRIILTDIENRQEYADGLRALGFGEQRLVVSVLKDRILKVLTFGSFQPATILALKAAS